MTAAALRAPRRTAGRNGPTCGALAGALVTAAVLSRGQRQASQAEIEQPQAFLPFPGAPPRTSARRPKNRHDQVVPPGAFQTVDATYNPTWLEIEERPASSLEWTHPQTLWAGAATLLYTFDMWRIMQLIPPTSIEVVCACVIYIGLYRSRLEDVPKLDKHYQISFYASVGWTVYALASLVHAMAFSPEKSVPTGLAEGIHGGACAVYLGSCIYFYSYHWGRHIRHVMEGRFRPWFAAGLASLTFAHGLTVGHIFKMLDDPKWYPTVQQIYPDQWQWIADTRLLELYLTAAALFLVILHLRGVLTGTKNAAIVFLGTVIVPTALLFVETFYLKAVSWQHYLMYGPKHW
mmetsp:Transcript_75574/g.233338  ORF Transcript_75574/g.233338 Transcript_75574/m.233338 type:complete len:348 (-) Transcript_75574:106-1149(-)